MTWPNYPKQPTIKFHDREQFNKATEILFDKVADIGYGDMVFVMHDDDSTIQCGLILILTGLSLHTISRGD